MHFIDYRFSCGHLQLSGVLLLKKGIIGIHGKNTICLVILQACNLSVRTMVSPFVYHLTLLLYPYFSWPIFLSLVKLISGNQFLQLLLSIDAKSSTISIFQVWEMATCCWKKPVESGKSKLYACHAHYGMILFTSFLYQGTFSTGLAGKWLSFLTESEKTCLENVPECLNCLTFTSPSVCERMNIRHRMEHTLRGLIGEMKGSLNECKIFSWLIKWSLNY